jgi:hypothetical protein
MATLNDAIQHIRVGNREQGRQILEELLEDNEGSEEVWLWLTAAVDSDEDREICLENVLALNPNNLVAQRGLDALQAGTFNAGDLLSDVLDEKGLKSLDEEEEESHTFIDDFVLAGEDEEELELPSSMRAKSKLRRRINPRLLVLLGLILIVVLGLGGLAVAGILFNLNSDETPPPEDNISTPQTPVEAEVPPTPTDTPTATSTPELASPTSAPKLQLPTARPTDLPTPIATQVVSPTPPGD